MTHYYFFFLIPVKNFTSSQTKSMMLRTECGGDKKSESIVCETCHLTALEKYISFGLFIYF